MNRYSLFIRVFFLGLLVTGNAVASPYNGNNESANIAQSIVENNVTPPVDLHNNWLLERVDKTADTIKHVPIPAAILLFGPATLCLLGLSSKRK